MMTEFFLKLRKAGVPVTLTEFLTLLEALSQRVTAHSIEEFYYLARAALVKDERHYDRFDQVFGAHFKGLETLFDQIVGVKVPVEWLHKLAELTLSEEDKRLIESLGGWEKLMETFAQRLAEQEGRHQGEAAIKAATNGSAPPASRRLALTAITPKASASVRKNPAIAKR